VRAELQSIVDALLAKSAPGEAVSLDQLGEAVGDRAVSQDEIEAMLAALERAGRPVSSPRRDGRADLHTVLRAARALREQHGRPATVAELSAHTGLSPEAVRSALALAQVMGR
jgi:DNA-binding MarR family transcriptional regulator